MQLVNICSQKLTVVDSGSDNTLLYMLSFAALQSQEALARHVFSKSLYIMVDFYFTAMRSFFKCLKLHVLGQGCIAACI